MNLSKNNLFARYYQWIYGNLPNDICSFFWGSVLAIGLLPIVAVGRLFHDRWELHFGKVLGAGLLFWIVYSVATLLGLIWYANFVLDLGDKGFQFSDYHLLNLPWYGLAFGMPLVFIGIVLACLLIVAVPVGIIYLICRVFGVGVSAAQRTVVAQNTADFVGAIRRKHCVKINWD